jgi:hypothetical protein
MWKKPQKNAPVKRLVPVTRANTWHAVSVVAEKSACEAVRALRNARFLSPEAPRLPLDHCSTPDSCRCAYKHHPDRRLQARRREELTGVRRSNYTAPERREQRGRRSTD